MADSFLFKSSKFYEKIFVDSKFYEKNFNLYEIIILIIIIIFLQIILHITSKITLDDKN